MSDCRLSIRTTYARHLHWTEEELGFWFRVQLLAMMLDDANEGTVQRSLRMDPRRFARLWTAVSPFLEVDKDGRVRPDVNCFEAA